MIPLIAAMLLLCCAACKEPGQKPTQAGAAPSAEKWQFFDDAELRFEYPNGWVVRNSIAQERLAGRWFIGVPNFGLGTLGLIMMGKGTLTENENRSLEEIAEESLKITKNSLHRPLGAVTKVGVKDGDCITFNIEKWVRECAPFDAMRKKRVPCIEPTMYAFCLTDSGRYYQIYSWLSLYHENGKPNDEARANGRIFERFLRSLEFKKG